MFELDAEKVLHVRSLLSVTVGIIVLFIGKMLNQRLTVLREYSIPEPVTGGLLFSIAIGVVYVLSGVQVDFDLTARDVLLVYFFTVIGINSKVGDLLRGGKPLGSAPCGNCGLDVRGERPRRGCCPVPWVGPSSRPPCWQHLDGRRAWHCRRLGAGYFRDTRRTQTPPKSVRYARRWGSSSPALLGDPVARFLISAIGSRRHQGNFLISACETRRRMIPRSATSPSCARFSPSMSPRSSVSWRISGSRS